MTSELSMDQVLIEKLNNILEANLDKEHFGVKELAKEVGLSRSQLLRKLKFLTGKSTSKYISEFRLKKAMEMLQNNEATASEIAYRVGFSSPTYFNTCFHDHFGYPPGEVKFRNPKPIEDNDATASIETTNASHKAIETTVVRKSLLSKKMVWINTFIIALLCVFSYYLYSNYQDYFSAEIPVTERSEKSIAIIPFKNISEANDDRFITLGVTSSLQSQLNTIKGLKVISENSMEKYADTTMTPSEIAKEVNVTYLLNGTVQKYKDSIRVIVHFIDAKEDTQLKSMVFIEEFNHLFELQSTIAKEVADELNIELSQTELEQINKRPTKNLEAYNLYLKGRFFWHRRTEEDLNKSIKYFNQALELDSTYALAYAGLADSYLVMPWYANVKDINTKGLKQLNKFTDSMFNLAKENALKSLLIDKNNAEVHATLGSILHCKDWNWEASEKELRHAINLNPNYATARQYYANLLRILARTKEAREQIDYALNLNPNSYVIQIISADLYYEDGLFEKAIQGYYKAKEINKFDPYTYELIAECYTYLGKGDRAMAEYEESFKLLEPSLNKEDLDLYNKAREEIQNSGIMGVKKFWTNRLIKKGKYPYHAALGLSFLGQKEKALDWLELAYEQRDPNLIYIKCHYEFINLRSEPRFLAILEKMNLGGYE